LPVNVSVIIVTLNRPDCVRQCLARLAAQEPQPDQIIVVDGSADDLTRRVVESFRSVLYLRNENGYGRMTASRNIGLKAARGKIIAFLDDDAFARDGWLANLLRTYEEHSDVGAVGGRALNNQPDEAKIGVDKIGRLTRDGRLEGWFAADPGKVIAVDHLMGCNMSFRREVLARLGGFREDYPGISGVREDSDMCLRVRRLGYGILFNPLACVDHIGAPQVKGKRFDWRYVYYANRNHTTMLIRNFGPVAGILWRNLAMAAVSLAGESGRRIAGALVRLGAAIVGILFGIPCGLWLRVKTGDDPARLDADGRAISRALGREESAEATAESKSHSLAAQVAP
jgi:GT2 family glycosyltransferase